MSELQALLAELGAKADALAASAAPAAEAPAAEEAPVAKSEAAPAEDAKEEAPAAAEAAPEAAAEEAPKEEAAEEGEVAKSFEVTDDQGNKLQAIDGFALLKSMQDEIDGLKAAFDALPKAEPEAVAKSFADAQAATDAQATTLAKSLAVALDKLSAADAALKAADERVAALEARFEAQDAVAKSLASEVEKIGAQGAGRRSAVTLHERPSVVAKAEPAMTVGQVLAKAVQLNREGKLTSIDVARINARANSGQPVPAEFQHFFAG